MSDEIKLTLTRECAELVRKWAYDVSLNPSTPKKEKTAADEVAAYLANILNVPVVVVVQEVLV